MKVAVVQLGASDCKNKNIERALSLARRAVRNRAEFILFPEAFNYRGPSGLRELQAAKEFIPGESIVPFQDLAKKHRVYILAGSICEAIKGRQKVYNTSVLINDKGRVSAKYRKQNLFDAKIGKRTLRESERFVPGDKGVCKPIGKFKAGLSVCYDLRFPGLYRGYAKKGASILCVPSVFTRFTGKAHWEVLLRARAVENLCYVLAPNQIGKDAKGVAAYGNSMIINPWGEVVARASSNLEEIIYGQIEKSVIKSKRKILPGI